MGSGSEWDQTLEVNGLDSLFISLTFANYTSSYSLEYCAWHNESLKLNTLVLVSLLLLQILFLVHRLRYIEQKLHQYGCFALHWWMVQ